jgi:hypothetical protein
LVPPTLWERVQATAHAYYRKIFTECGAPANDAPELRKCLERLEQKVDKLAGTKTTTTNKTWAQVAGEGSGSTAPAQEQRVQRVPKKLFRELIVDTGDAGPDITERAPRDTVAAVNTAAGPTGPKGAIAAKKLPKSGNIAITFEEEHWAWFADETNQAWVTRAFGASAVLKRRTFAVLAKGVRTAVVDGYNGDMAALAKDLSATSKVKVARLRAREPRRSTTEEGRPRTMQLLIEVHTVEEANRLIDRGAIIDYSVYPCERFEGAARATICYKCGSWGHKATFCKANEVRCLLCGCGAHTQDGTAREREAQCPVRQDPATNKPKCLNCGGAQPAFDAGCKVAKEQRQRARERFLDRPLAFQAPPAPQVAPVGMTALAPLSQRSIAQAPEERPRKRPAKAGRPSNLTKAGQTNGSDLSVWAQRSTALATQEEITREVIMVEPEGPEGATQDRL